MKRIVVRLWTDIDGGVLGEVMRFENEGRMIAGYTYHYVFFGKAAHYVAVSDEAISRESALAFCAAHHEGKIRIFTIDLRGV